MVGTSILQLVMNNPLKIYLIRTFYRHWSQHSGINQFVKYIDRSQFQIKEHLVMRNRSNLGLVRYAKRKISDAVRRGGPGAYMINDFLAEINGFRYFARKGYDVLFYLDGEHSLNYLPKWLRRGYHRRKPPKIVAMFHQPPERLCQLSNIDMLHRIDHAIVLSQVQADSLSQHLPKEKISTVLHGIDVDYFHPERSKKKKKFICLSVGTWLRDYDTVVRVAERLKVYTDIEFHIVSSEVNPPTRLSNIHMHKNISDAELLSLYQRANVLLMPLFDATANNVILEALACGLPVITTKLPGTMEYLTGQEGILISPQKPELYLKELMDLYEKRNRLDSKSEYARKRAVELSWPNFAGKIEKLFKYL
jgi:glycosyltransferase involved in cell wall biosynthesis